MGTFFAAAAASSWPGQAHNGTIYNYCGTKKTLPAESINATCTLDFNGYNFAHISIPRCFSQGKGYNIVECNGVEGVTDPANLDVTIFWQQELDFNNNLQEVTADHLGPEWAGYVVRITGGNDKQGFPMKQGVGSVGRVKLLLSKGQSCYTPGRSGERKRKSVRGCIVNHDLSILNLMIVKKGAGEIEGL